MRGSQKASSPRELSPQVTEGFVLSASNIIIYVDCYKDRVMYAVAAIDFQLSIQNPCPAIFILHPRCLQWGSGVV